MQSNKPITQFNRRRKRESILTTNYNYTVIADSDDSLETGTWNALCSELETVSRIAESQCITQLEDRKS